VKIRRALICEIVLVAGLVAAIATMGFMNLTGARRAKNENHARLLIQSFHFAQQQFHHETQSDRDDDEQGEFGTLAELLSLKETQSYRRFAFFEVSVPEKVQIMREDFRRKLAVPDVEPPAEIEDPKKHQKMIAARRERKELPRVLFDSPLFDQQKNRLIYDGYALRIFLPQLLHTTSDMTEEDKITALTDDVEKYWCAFSWPLRYGSSGTESYFVDFHGKLYTCDDPNLSEDADPPPQVRAIDAYKGREFTSPINDEVWKPWTAPRPPARKEPPKKEDQKDGEPAAEPGKEGETPVDKGPAPEGAIGVPKDKGITPPLPGKETDDEADRRKKLLDEAAGDVDLKVRDD